MKTIHHRSLLLRLAVFAFIIYVAATLVTQQLSINREKAQLASLKTQYEQQTDKNAEIQRVLSEGNDQYMESIARDKLGYAQTNERIYVNVTGD